LESSDQQVLKHRSYTFKTVTTWNSGKTGSLTSAGKPPLAVSTPVEFRGEAGTWTPEELFVGSVEICHMSTFLSYAARRGLPILAYRSHANGVLEFVDGDFRFTRIVVFPTITVGSSASESDVYTTLREAQKHCLVANSIASIVEISPTIVIE